MHEKIKKIMSAVFETPADQINEMSSPDNLEKWDSLNHIVLISALEDEYNIRLTDEQIGDMLNFRLIIETLKESGVSNEIL